MQLCRPKFERESVGIDRQREGSVFEIESRNFAGQNSSVRVVIVLELIASVRVKCVGIKWKSAS